MRKWFSSWRIMMTRIFRWSWWCRTISSRLRISEHTSSTSLSSTMISWKGCSRFITTTSTSQFFQRKTPPTQYSSIVVTDSSCPMTTMISIFNMRRWMSKSLMTRRLSVRSCTKTAICILPFSSGSWEGYNIRKQKTTRWSRSSFNNQSDRASTIWSQSIPSSYQDLPTSVASSKVINLWASNLHWDL